MPPEMTKSMNTNDEQAEGTKQDDSRQTSSGCDREPAPMAAGDYRRSDAQPPIELKPCIATELAGLRAELAVRRHECAAQTKNAIQLRETLGQCREALEQLWTGVVEMNKDANTDYVLPRLARLDLQSMTNQECRVRAALEAAGAVLGDVAA